MTWREQLICRVLLLVARLVADDGEIAAELRHLDNHIRMTAPKLAVVE